MITFSPQNHPEVHGIFEISTVAYQRVITDAFASNRLDARVGRTDSGGTRTFKRDGAGVTDAVLSDGVSAYTPGVSVRTSGATRFNLAYRFRTLGIETDAWRSTLLAVCDAFRGSADVDPSRLQRHVNQCVGPYDAASSYNRSAKQGDPAPQPHVALDKDRLRLHGLALDGGVR